MCIGERNSTLNLTILSVRWHHVRGIIAKMRDNSKERELQSEGFFHWIDLALNSIEEITVSKNITWEAKNYKKREVQWQVVQMNNRA